MFDISFAELLLIIVTAVVFIGPRELPAVARAVARAMRALRSLYNEARKSFDDLARETGLKDTADAIHTEMRLIKGDDGKLYESYDISHLPRRGE